MGIALVVIVVIGIIAALIYGFVVKACPTGFIGPKCEWVITSPADSTSATSNVVAAKSLQDCANMCAADTANCSAAVFDSSGMCHKIPKLDNVNKNNSYTLLTPKSLDISKLTA
jgi:hypothetical protein